MKRLFIMLISIVLLTTTNYATNYTSFTNSGISTNSALVLGKQAGKYPLNYLTYNSADMYSAFKKGNYTSYYAVAYVFTPSTCCPGNYNITVYFVYGEDEDNYTPVNAPAGGITISATATIGGSTYPYSATIPQGQDHYALNAAAPGYPTLSGISITPSTYLGQTIYAYNGN